MTAGICGGSCLVPENPIRHLAPEMVTHEGRDYLLAYQWRNDDPRGIFMVPMTWEAGNHPGAPK